MGRRKRPIKFYESYIEYISSPYGSKNWADSSRYFFETNYDDRFDDGFYNTRIIDASINVPKRKMEHHVNCKFIFEFVGDQYKGKQISKFYNLEDPLSICNLKKDLFKFGNRFVGPDQLPDIIEKIDEKKPYAYIHIQNAQNETIIDILEKMEYPKNEVKDFKSEKEFVDDQPKNLKEEYLGKDFKPDEFVEDDTPPKSNEVEIKEGDRVKYRYENKYRKGTILIIFEDQNQIVIKDDEGQKYVVKSGDLISVLLPKIKEK